MRLPWDFCYDLVAGGILLCSGQTMKHDRCVDTWIAPSHLCYYYKGLHSLIFFLLPLLCRRTHLSVGGATLWTQCSDSCSVFSCFSCTWQKTILCPYLAHTNATSPSSFPYISFPVLAFTQIISLPFFSIFSASPLCFYEDRVVCPPPPFHFLSPCLGLLAEGSRDSWPQRPGICFFCTNPEHLLTYKTEPQIDRANTIYCPLLGCHFKMPNCKIVQTTNIHLFAKEYFLPTWETSYFISLLDLLKGREKFNVFRWAQLKICNIIP